MKSKSCGYYREIMEEMHLVDSHAHICTEESWHKDPRDFTQIIAYCYTDLVSAGMSRDELNHLVAGEPTVNVSYGYSYKPDERTAEEKWEIVKPYWQYVRNIGSGLHARRALKLFFGCDDLTDETIPVITKKMIQLQKKSYEELFGQFKIDRVVNVSSGSADNHDGGVMLQQLQTDAYAQPVDKGSIYQLEQASGCDIYSLETYIKALDAYLYKEVKENGMIGFKWQRIPFMRPQSFELASSHEASKALDRILTRTSRGSIFSGFGCSYDEMIPLHNYLHHHIVQQAIELDVPVQIHTGTFGVTMGNKLQNSNPTLLCEMFLRYPQARFNLLHSGWPYCREIGELARQFPNVFLNTTWMQMISPLAFKNYMKEWLLWVPTNKILGFGSDEFTPLNSCACADIYRDLMAEVLSELTEEERMTEKDAVHAAELVSSQNVYSHWKLIS